MKLFILTTSALALLAAAPARAFSDIWTGAADAGYTNPLNWLNGFVPGEPLSTPGSPDAATFAGSANTAVMLGGDRNLKYVLFDNASRGLGAFSLGGGALVISDNIGGAGGFILSGATGAANQTINSPVTVTRNNGNADLLIATAAGYGGTLAFNGAITTSAGALVTQIGVRGGVGSTIVFNGGINDNLTGQIQVNVANSTVGTVLFGGTNTFTGGLIAAGGRVRIDDSAAPVVIPSSNMLTMGGATLEFKAASTGATTHTFATLNVATTSSSRMVLNPNGGTGLTVEFGALDSPASNAVPLNLIDLSEGNSVLKTTSPLPIDTTARVQLVNNLVMTAGTGALPSSVTTYRGATMVRDAGGVGFATQNANNELVRFTGATPLGAADDATVTDITSHYILNTDLTRTAPLPFSTLQLDTSTSAVTLDMGANAFNATAANGRQVLITGGNAARITGTANIPTTIWFRNYGTGSLTIEQVLPSGAALISAGPGLTISTKTHAADVYIAEGTTRFTATTNYTAGVLRIFDGGILEIGADLNGATAGDFSRTVGTAAGNVAILGSGGFSAFGGDRTVNLGNVGATLAWGGTNFVGGTFILSSSTADGTLIFANGINLNGGDREIRVNNGSAAVDARLTGALSNSNSVVPAGLYKTGSGTLALDAAQTYLSLTTAEGETDLNAALGFGNSILTANAKTDISVSQTLAQLNIGAGTVVTLEGLAPAPAVHFAAVPEPGSLLLLAAGVLGFAGRRRAARSRSSR